MGPLQGDPPEDGPPRGRRGGLPWGDLLLVLGVAGVLYGVAEVAARWARPLQRTVEIDLSPGALPGYALLSLSRGLLAYVLSLAFALGFGLWAARDRRAGRILLPLLDVLQSIPVLGFMPGLVLAVVGAFPGSNAGLELAAILMIFTGQAWNLAFGFHQSLTSLPLDLAEAARAYRFDRRATFRRLELPFATTGLVWNSMMSMAGGWFFLMVNEAFVLGDRDFRLPGLGSYMSVAVAQGDVPAMLLAIAAMTALIVALDQVLWRPAVVWAQRFRVEESAATAAMHSWFLTLLRRSRLLAGIARRWSARRAAAPASPPPASRPARAGPSPASTIGLAILVLGLGLAAYEVLLLLRTVDPAAWAATWIAGGWTLVRVLAAVLLGTLWALPAGLAIGRSPRLSRVLQPVVQVLASFPAPMLFPVALLGLDALGVGLGAGSVALMLLGTQWYVLFNVIAGASAIPADLREAAASYRFTRWQTFWRVDAPAVFPHLVTGWVTAAGGAWNASIVSEYVTQGGRVRTADGLGARIGLAAQGADFAVLAASVVTMSLIVVAFNALVWRRCWRLADARFSLSR